MEKIKNILEKIKPPLYFASQNNFKNLPNIKDLGKTILRLLDILKKSLPASLQKDYFESVDALFNIFIDYDRQELEVKKNKIQSALDILKLLNTNAKFTMPDSKFKSAHADNSIQNECKIKEALAKLNLPIQYLKGVGPKMAQRFLAKKISTVEDLLYFLPRTYEDRREIKKIIRLEKGKTQAVIGTVILSEYKYYGRKKVLEVTISDNTANLTAKWFKGRMSYVLEILKKGTKVIFSGNVTGNYSGKIMIHPDYEVLDGAEEENLLNFKRIVPVYSETEGLHQKYVRKIINQALENYGRYVISPIPLEFCEKRSLISFKEALHLVHFPEHNEDIEEYNFHRSPAHRRLIYDEFFFFQLGMAVKKSSRVLDPGINFRIQSVLLEKFYSNLSFSLTSAQKRVIEEIKKDMSKEIPMNRLLQGDVGSGKTVVAMTAMIIACDNNYQAALMAPTEILAKQHFQNINRWAKELGLKVVLLTGNMNSADRKESLGEICSGKADIIIGTHALIQEDVDFYKLGLVVTDEQHRFGVLQRAILRSKGINADVLVMTATPIPRTLAMTVYGDLDVSVIDEMPPGKKPVNTILMGETKRINVYHLIDEELAKGHQAFIVYPLVEQSENLDLKDATNMAVHLQNDIFPNYKIGLIHGRMKEKEKDSVMRDFLENKINILVATTVIEVGIDIPKASLMVIEHAERFGLSQLHQLRGRVGRRDIPSKCILLADYKASADARKRLKIMEKTIDGFALAEEDLAIRGPGDFYGTRQSGLPDFRIASIISNAKILNDAKEDAFQLVACDNLLEKQEHAVIREILFWRWKGKLDLARTG